MALVGSTMPCVNSSFSSRYHRLSCSRMSGAMDLLTSVRTLLFSVVLGEDMVTSI